MNGEAKHTPGPWVKRYCDRVTTSDDPDGMKPIAHCYSRGHDCEANARLIAAAPDLLQACELVAKALEADKSGEVLWACDGNTAWEVLTEAISKAKGETP